MEFKIYSRSLQISALDTSLIKVFLPALLFGLSKQSHQICIPL